MIKELADYENLADQVAITEKDLRQTLFGPGAIVYDTVVEDERDHLAGHALWFRTFSTFLGQSGIWLEDLYVRPAHRRQGHARELLDLPTRPDPGTPRVGGARVERAGARLLPAARSSAHVGLDALPLVRGVARSSLNPGSWE